MCLHPAKVASKRIKHRKFSSASLLRQWCKRALSKRFFCLCKVVRNGRPGVKSNSAKHSYTQQCFLITAFSMTESCIYVIFQHWFSLSNFKVIILFFERYLGLMTQKSKFSLIDMSKAEGSVPLYIFSGVQVRQKVFSQGFN